MFTTTFPSSLGGSKSPRQGRRDHGPVTELKDTDGYLFRFEALELGAFGLPWIRTEVFDRALWAFRFFRQTDSPAVVLHEMAEADALFCRHDRRQVGFDFVRVGLCGETEALR